MDSEKTLLEKVLAGKVAVETCDLSADFSLDELGVLLDRKLIRPEDLPRDRAADLMVKGVVSLLDYPFEALAPQDQIRLLEEGMIDLEAFRDRADLDAFSGSDWLRLLACRHEVASEAPREKIRRESTREDWAQALRKSPSLLEDENLEQLFGECPCNAMRAGSSMMEQYLDALVQAELKANRRPEPLVPQNKLEAAILKEDYAWAVGEVIQHEVLTRLDVLVEPQFLHAPVPVIVFILQSGLQPGLWESSRDFKDRFKFTVAKLIRWQITASAAANDIRNDGGQLVYDAIRDHDDIRVRAAIRKCGVRLNLSSELKQLMVELPALKPMTVVMLFQRGLLEEAQPAFLRFLMTECTSPTVLKPLSYRQRLMYANLMIHIMMGLIGTDDQELIAEDWYPMGSSVVGGTSSEGVCHDYGFYYDPRRRYEPLIADDGDQAVELADTVEDNAGNYETPSHVIRRKK